MIRRCIYDTFPNTTHVQAEPINKYQFIANHVLKLKNMTKPVVFWLAKVVTRPKQTNTARSEN